MKRKEVKKGFTLIEMMVVVSIFLILSATLISILILSLRAQRRASNLNRIVDTSSYVLEYMSRALRMAKKDIGGTCITQDKNFEVGTNNIKFLNYNDQCQTFFLENGQLKEQIGRDSFPLTSDEFEISQIEHYPLFQVEGDEKGHQPLVTIRFQIQKRGEPETRIQFQTSVSQRNLNVD